MKKVIVFTTITLTSLLIVFGGGLLPIKLATSSGIGVFIETLSGRRALNNRIRFLEKENVNLRARIFSEDIISPSTVKVYSTHPLGSRGEVAIAAGSKQDVSVGDTVTYGDNVLVGKITRVFEDVSIVSTIFNPSLEMQVRIGKGEVDALLQGGNELNLTLISQDARVEEGEIVVSASKDFPYGLEVGFVKSVRAVPGDVFQEAVIEPAFQLKRLRDVVVRR